MGNNKNQLKMNKLKAIHGLLRKFCHSPRKLSQFKKTTGQYSVV